MTTRSRVDRGTIAMIAAAMVGVAYGGSGDAGARAAQRGCPVPVITAPPDGAVLKAKVATFAWTGSADDLRVGTTPGAADIFATPLLEDATSQVVSTLPLDGAPFYVQLRARCKSAEAVATNSYVAGIRRGLAVVVDFADARLEDWQEAPTSEPPGFHSMQEVRDVLDDMEDHWEWLSHGTERMVWDLRRVQLAESLTANAFPAYREYRRAVLRAVAEQGGFDPTDYDVQADGLVEGIWIVASAREYLGGEPGFGYLLGSSAEVDGVTSFADSQGAFAVRYRRYGAFNHEFGHGAGLPDLYGRYSTVNGLSLMAVSVGDLPAADLGAFERRKLGWLKPTIVGRKARGLVVPSANEELAALEVRTEQSYEYFLIEYRKTPDSGFGSVGPRYDGLAVYHVFEPSIQIHDPPLLRLEAAGAPLSPEAFVQPDDLFHPGNPAMQLPHAVRSYLTGRVVFEITGVERTAEGMRVDLRIRSGKQRIRLPNLVQNPSFEAGSATPDAWTAGGLPASFDWTTQTAHTRRHSVSVSSQGPTDSEWRQQVSGLAVGRSYLLCGWVKGRDIERFESKRVGGTIGLSASFDQASAGYGTFDWRQTCLSFQATSESMSVACRLGGWGSTAAGTMWCDDVSVVLPERAF
jgi:M6 family metalloprotease-like protein